MQVCSDGVFAITEGRTRFIINANDMTCDCNYWQITWILCKHVVRDLMYLNENLEE